MAGIVTSDARGRRYGTLPLPKNLFAEDLPSKELTMSGNSPVRYRGGVRPC